MKWINGLLTLLIFISACSTEQKKFTKLSPNQTKIDFVNKLYETHTKNYFTYPYMYLGGGVAVGDFNNDGLEDLFFTGNMVPNKLYLNEGDFKFKDISETAGIQGDDRWYSGVSVIDINNDGYLDLYIAVGGENEPNNNVLYINNQDNTFTEKAKAYGIDDDTEDTNASFFDADNDGDLDLYIVSGGYAEKDSGLPLHVRLYLNEDGMYKLSKNLVYDDFIGSVVVPWDYDSDGDLDLFVGTRVKQADFPISDPSLILHNNGKGEFKSIDFNILNEMGLVTDAKAKDLDGDGIDELIVVGDWNYPRIYKSSNSEIYEATSSFFVENLNGWWNTIEVDDFDNDGDLDLISSGQNSNMGYSYDILKNDGVGNFTLDSQTFNENYNTSEGHMLIFDIDNDGNKELLIEASADWYSSQQGWNSFKLINGKLIRINL